MDKIIGYIKKVQMFNVKKWYATTSNDEEENKGEKKQKAKNGDVFD